MQLSDRSPTSLFSFSHIAAFGAVAIGSSCIGSGSVPQVKNLISAVAGSVDGNDLQQQQLCINYHFLSRIVYSLAIVGIIVAITATLYFLGHFRFDITPVSAANEKGSTEPGEGEESSATETTDSRLWLYECHHYDENYLCFPPYCAPGGLRSRLFPASHVKGATNCDRNIEVVADSAHKSQTRERTGPYHTTSSTNNPLDIILASPYLPHLVKQTLERGQRDWNTLGGSKCSCKRHFLSVQKELELTSSGRREGTASTHPLEAGECCSTKRGEAVNKFRGLEIAGHRLINQAISSYHSHQRNQAEAQDPSVSTVDQAEELQQHHFSASPQQEVFPPTSSHQAMTAQQNTDPTPATVAMAMPTANEKPPLVPLPQAVLVYHESAHSIVFRDHLRRQQGAIRRHASSMENSSHHQHSPDQVFRKQPSSQPVSDSNGATPATSRAPSTILEESDVGYESGGSRGSTRSNRSSHSARSGGESSASVASGGSAKYRTAKTRMSKPKKTVAPVVIANFQPLIEPLEELDLDSSNVFEPLMDADPFREGNDALELSDAESEVVELLKNERAVVKTIRNADWTAFLKKFKPSEEGGSGEHEHHPAHRGHQKESHDMKKGDYPFNSFVTSTSLLPSCTKKMRCFGSTNEYAIGAVFALPKAFPYDASEDDAAKRTRTWSWPSGYSAKTEFNIDHHGNLINGREEALVPMSGLRKMNHSYLYDKDYIVGGRMVKGGLNTIPYNEVYIRVGGHGRIVGGVDLSSGKACDDADGSGRDFDHGIGLPVALFVREVDYGHLVRLFRTRARLSAIFGANTARGIPLLYITPERGVRVFNERLQHQVLKKMSSELNPFQNPSLAHKTGIDNTSEAHLQQKLEELLDLDDCNMRQVLTPEEMARIAGGFGATDESVSNLLNHAMQRDILESTGGKNPHDSHKLQDLVNEGLSFALRANDYHTSRQLLILYTLVASKRSKSNAPLLEADGGYQSDSSKASSSSTKWRDTEKDVEKERHLERDERTLGKHFVPPPPPPPPLDTDRLRSATNSDGLLAVLGAAQVLRSMQDGSAKRRVKECIDSIEEWIENGEQSVAFRVASWRDQRAAQGDLKIATENDSNFMAFISNKAISNRKKFAQQLRDAAAVTDFDSLEFLRAIHVVASQMNSPCLRLELLQYILGLDNRYSVAHVTRSVELAATCLNLSEAEVLGDQKKLLND